jgi:hypothetical protein
MKKSLVFSGFSSLCLVLAGCGGSDSNAGGATGGSGGDGGAAGSGGSSTGGDTANAGTTGDAGGGNGGDGSGGNASGGVGNGGDGNGGSAGEPADGGAAGNASELDGGADAACPTGYTGSTCADCAVGYVDDNGSCVEACTVVECGDEGTCVLDDASQAVCQCNKGFGGDACDECAPGYRAIPVVIGDPLECELDTPSTTNMVVWLDANHLDSFSLSGSSVISWNSRVAGGLFTTADSSTRPTRPAVFNGQPFWVRFDGVDDRIHRITDFGNTYSVYVVARAAAKASEQFFLHGLGETNIDRTFRLVAQDTATTVLMRHGMPAGNDELSVTLGTTTPTIIEGHRFPGIIPSLVLHDGTTYQSQAVTQEAYDQALDLFIGRSGTSSLGPLDGYIGEIIIFSPALQSGDRKPVRDYLTAKWGL